MSDLISREALMDEYFRKCNRECCTCVERDDESGECGLVRYAPAVDAEPVRYSAWESEGDGYFFCKGCKKYIVCIGGDADLNYCPNCGAKMEVDDEK